MRAQIRRVGSVGAKRLNAIPRVPGPATCAGVRATLPLRRCMIGQQPLPERDAVPVDCSLEEQRTALVSIAPVVRLRA